MYEAGELLALYVGLFWISAATLFFEITLTRLFSVTQWYHFAFISVSVALLGFGASGTWLALRPWPSDHGLWQRQLPEERNPVILNRLALFAGLFSISILVTYLAINYVPFDSYRIAWERRQLLYLAVYYSALIVPFFFSGLCIGLSLSSWPERANAVYAANLAGSATGSIMVLVLVPLLGGTGAVTSASILGSLAAVAFTLGAYPRRHTLHWGYGALLAGLLILLAHPPPVLQLRLSPYKTLSVSLLFPQAQLAFTRWNAFSRIDVIESPGIHSAPGLSLSFTGGIPKQMGLLLDGGNLSPITCIQQPGDEQFLRYLPTALPYLLRPRARVLCIEPRGGLDLLSALNGGASSVVALEGNPLVVRAVRQQAGPCGAQPYNDPRVTVVLEDARSYLRRSTQRFDVVLLSLAETYQPVISGAYSLSESYAYTVEAFVEYLRHLSEDGILVATRWMQSPPSEELRAQVLLVEALERTGAGDPSVQVIAFRSWSTTTILAKRTPFRPEEIAQWKDFCSERSFDLIYYDGMSSTEANRYNLLPDTAHYDTFKAILSRSERQDMLRGYPYEVSPPTDDRPFFFHYFKWDQTRAILRSLGKTWQPFGGSGFLVLIALLALALVLSVLLVLLPLAVRDRPAVSQAVPFLLYFSCLGFGYLFVEMPLLQQFILFLGQPAYSFSVVLFSILLFSGLGSLASAKLSLRPLLLALVVAVLAYPLVLPRMFSLCIGWALPLRIAVAALGLGPLGFLLGLPLPAGIRLLEKRAPQLVPWAWAVNGCASVISSILAAIGAVTLGFSHVLAGGAVAYFAAWVIVASTLSRPEATA